MPQDYYTTDNDVAQGEAVPLIDKTRTGRERPWAHLKSINIKLADIYDILEDDNKSARLRDCGRILDFAVTSDGLRLRHGNLCHVRLCPLCQWRRALKVQSQMSQVLDHLPIDSKCAMITLTLRNVRGDSLSDTLDVMMEGVRRLMMYARVASAVIGWYRALEITQSRGKYHPHYHMIWVLASDYIDGKYISQRALCDLWRQACKLDYTPVCDIRLIQPHADTGISGAIREVCKYTVKPSDLITGYIDLDINTVADLDSALDGRRNIGLGGIIKQIHHDLHLSKIDDDSDLELADKGDIGGDEQHVYYCWCSGYQGYYTHARYVLASTERS
jgi:plasmid rolling circle replication initiator protein Rep